MRLTAKMRDTIRRRVLDKARAPRIALLEEREHALAAALMKQRYGADVFERCAAFPAGWFPVGRSFALEYGLVQSLPRTSVEAQFCKGRCLYPQGYISLDEARAIPHSASHGWGREVAGPLYNDLHDLFRDLVELVEETASLDRQIKATLASFSTVEKLAEGWPEGYAELPAEMLRVVSNLPAPRIDDLNARLAALAQAA